MGKSERLGSSGMAKEGAKAARLILQQLNRTIIDLREHLWLHDLLGQPVPVQAPPTKQGHLIRVLGGQVEIMEDDDHGMPLLGKLASLGQEHVLMGGVETGGRFVEQEHPRRSPTRDLSQGAGEDDPLPFPARKLGRIPSSHFL